MFPIRNFSDIFTFKEICHSFATTPFNIIALYKSEHYEFRRYILNQFNRIHHQTQNISFILCDKPPDGWRERPDAYYYRQLVGEEYHPQLNDFEIDIICRYMDIPTEALPFVVCFQDLTRYSFNCFSFKNISQYRIDIFFNFMLEKTAMFTFQNLNFVDIMIQLRREFPDCSLRTDWDGNNLVGRRLRDASDDIQNYRFQKRKGFISPYNNENYTIILPKIRKNYLSKHKQTQSSPGGMAEIQRHDTAIPFICGNTQCKKEYDIFLFAEVSLLWGFIYLVSEDNKEAVIGLTCPHCYKTTLKKCPFYVAGLLHLKIQKQIKATTNSNHQINKSAYYSSEILKESGLIKHTYTIDVKDGEKQFVMPKNISCQKHKAITESSFPSLCDIENNHHFRAIPRVVAYYNELDGILEEKENGELNAFIIKELIKHNNKHWNNNLSAQFKHMITNDLTEQEYNGLYLDKMVFREKQFEDNIKNFVDTAYIVRNCIDYDIISRDYVINWYARKIYTFSEDCKCQMSANYYPKSDYYEQYTETNPHVISVSEAHNQLIQEHIQNKTAEPSIDQPSNYDEFLNEQNNKLLKEMDNAFSKEGDVWIVKFKGKTTTIKHNKRMFYLIHLVNTPDQSIENIKLQNMVNESYGNISKITEVEESKINLQLKDLHNSNDTLSTTYDLGRELDIKDIIDTEKKYKNEVDALLRKQSKAKNNNDMEEFEDIEDEIKLWIEACKKLGANPIIKKDQNGVKCFYPNLVKISKKTEKARKNVANNINNALVDIKSILPDLYEYMDEHITRDLISTGFFPKKGSIDKALKWAVVF